MGRAAKQRRLAKIEQQAARLCPLTPPPPDPAALARAERMQGVWLALYGPDAARGLEAAHRAKAARLGLPAGDPRARIGPDDLEDLPAEVLAALYGLQQEWAPRWRWAEDLTPPARQLLAEAVWLRWQRLGGRGDPTQGWLEDLVANFCPAPEHRDEVARHWQEIENAHARRAAVGTAPPEPGGHATCCTNATGTTCGK